MDESLKNNFLNNFADDKRNQITQQFCAVVRKGAASVSELLEAVNLDAITRLNSPYTDDATREAQQILIGLIESTEAADFANFIWWRESLPKEERLKLKYQRGQQYANQAMGNQPATDKQLKYLQGLGCGETPKSKLHASQLIEQFKRAL